MPSHSKAAVCRIAAVSTEFSLTDRLGSDPSPALLSDPGQVSSLASVPQFPHLLKQTLHVSHGVDVMMKWVGTEYM